MEEEYTMVTFTVRISEYEYDQHYFYPRKFVNSKLDVDLINEFFGRDLTQADSDTDFENRYWDSDRLLEVSNKVPFKATKEEIDKWYSLGIYGDNISYYGYTK
jgi:hypothetical protein